MKKSKRKRIMGISLLVIFIAISSYSVGIPFLDLMEYRTVDLRFKTREKIPPSSKVVLAVIDEKSLDKEGKWLWPRSKIADLITKLSDYGTKVIAMDLFFPEPDLKEPENDKILSNAIRNSKAKVILSFFFHMQMERAKYIDEHEIKIRERNIQGGFFNRVDYLSEKAPYAALIDAVVPESNIAEISESTKYCGYTNIMPAQDGTVRWLPLIIRYKKQFYAPLTLMALSAYLDQPLEVKIEDYGIKDLTIGSMHIPTDELGAMIINFRGGTKTFSHISVTDILNGEISRKKLQDKIVIVGTTALGIEQQRVTPFSANSPAVEIHANAIDCILSKDFLQKPGGYALFDLGAIVCAGLLLGYVLSLAGAFTGGAALLLMITGFIIYCQYLFSKGIVLNATYPILTTGLIYLSVVTYQYFIEEREKKESLRQRDMIRNMFGQYISDEIVDELLSSPDGIKRDGELREVTFLVSDLRGFTAISNKLTPNEVISLINRYLERMVEIIFQYKGTICEIEGDAILTFFGAPLAASNDPERAVACAIEMQNSMEEINTEQRRLNLPEISMGIGINTGKVVVGTIGSKKRAKYGAIGSAINTVFRVESYTVGGQILLSHSTQEKVQSLTRVRGAFDVNFKGRELPFRLYDITGIKGKFQKSLHTIGTDAYIDLENPLPISCFFIEGKHVTERIICGHITRLGKSSAEAVLDEKVEVYANLKIALRPQGEFKLSEFYVKVVLLEQADTLSIKANLNFTHLPEDVKSFFEDMRNKNEIQTTI